jgi:hypothetical protein
VVNGSIFSGNSAVFLRGGAIDNSVAATLTVSNSSFAGNSAGLGGAIDNESFASMTLTGSTFAGNSAGSLGGGIFNEFAASLSVSDSTFSANSAGSDGGGIFNYFGTVNLATSSFCMNSPDNIVGGFNDLGGNTFC